MRRWWWAVRRRWLEWKLRRALARSDAHRIVVLPPPPPCDHLDEVTIPHPMYGSGRLVVCAYCGLVLQQV